MLLANEQEIVKKKKNGPQQTKQITTFYEIINCTATSVWSYVCVILIVMITGVLTIQLMLAMYHSSYIDIPDVNQNVMHRFQYHYFY